MSQRVVGYEGEGRSRRRIVVDEGPATAAARHPMAMVERGGAPARELTGPTGGAGEIERRQLYAAEDDIRAEEARAARIHRPTPVKAATSQESRLRGAHAHRDRAASPRPDTPPEEEPAMTDAIAGDTSVDSLETEVDVDEPLEPVAIDEALEQLATRATVAASLWIAKVDAEEAAEVAKARWQEARELLEMSWARAGLGGRLVAAGGRLQALTDLVEAAEDAIDEAVAEADGETQVAPTEPPPNIPEIIPAPRPADPPPADLTPDLSRLSTHQRMVLEATIRHRGDRKLVANELGLTAAINVEMSLESIGKKGLLPADLIAILPARFARYATVAER